MFGSEALGVAIGLVFVYFLLSLLCSAVNELIARIVGLRSRTLLVGIRTLLADAQIARALNRGWPLLAPFRAIARQFRALFRRNDPTAPAQVGSPLTQLLYAHPLINGLYKQEALVFNGGLPSYIPSETFARALLHSLVEQVSPSLPVAGVAEEIRKLDDKRYKDAKPILIGDLLERVARRGDRLWLKQVTEAVNKVVDDVLTAKEREDLLANLNRRARLAAGATDCSVSFLDVKEGIDALPERGAWRKAARDAITAGLPAGPEFALDVAETTVEQTTAGVLTSEERKAIRNNLTTRATPTTGSAPRALVPDDIDIALRALPERTAWREAALTALTAGPLAGLQTFDFPRIEAAVKQVAAGMLTAEERKALLDDLQKRTTPTAGGAVQPLKPADIEGALGALPERPLLRQAALVAITAGLPLDKLGLAFAEVADSIVALKGGAGGVVKEADRATLLRHMAEYAVQVGGTPRPQPLAYADIVRAVNVLPDEPYRDLKRALLALMSDVKGDIAQLQQAVAAWFDDAMERVSGWYKRRVGLIIAMISLVVAVAMNADTFTLANTLWRDATLRASVVAAAERAVLPTATPAASAAASSPAPSPAGTGAATGSASPSPAQTSAAPASATGSASGSPTQTAGASGQPITQIGEIQNELASLKLPLGWVRGDNLPAADPRRVPVGRDPWVSKIVGLLVTAIALSLGAPFWFQVLSKLVNLRAAGDPPKPTDESDSSGK